jgi:hypothetical protein
MFVSLEKISACAPTPEPLIIEDQYPMPVTPSPIIFREDPPMPPLNQKETSIKKRTIQQRAMVPPADMEHMTMVGLICNGNFFEYSNLCL